MLKCEECKLIFKDRIESCPECGNTNFIETCENDPGTCNHGVVSGTKVCEVCGEFVCPTCGAHDCIAMSRNTGYYSPIGNGSWNGGKKEELKNRKRYDIL